MDRAPGPLGNRHKNQSQIAKRFGLSRGGEARSRISVDMSAFDSPADVLRDRYRGGGLIPILTLNDLRLPSRGVRRT